MQAKCPSCGSTGECAVEVVPGSEMDQEHVYTFQCGLESCGHVEQRAVYAGDSVDNPQTDCPFCGNKKMYHKPTPVPELAE